MKTLPATSQPITWSFSSLKGASDVTADGKIQLENDCKQLSFSSYLKRRMMPLEACPPETTAMPLESQQQECTEKSNRREHISSIYILVALFLLPNFGKKQFSCCEIRKGGCVKT
jgi:hypothetical protein